MDILELKKVLNEKEKVSFTFEIDKESLQGFIVLFRGIGEISRYLSVNIRNAENIRKERLDAHQRAAERHHNQIKEDIRATYLKHLESLKDIMKAFKKTRSEYQLYAWLVREVRQEFRAKRELEIFRLNNMGTPSQKIAEKLYMNAGAVRKIIGAWKYHRTLPLTEKNHN